MFNVDQTAVSNWEKGKNSISIDIAKAIAAKYFVPLEWVYGYTPDRYLYSIEDLREGQKEDIKGAENAEQRDYRIARFRVPIYNKKAEEMQIEQKETPPAQLTDGEVALLEKFSRIPQEQRTLFFEMLEVFLKNQK